MTVRVWTDVDVIHLLVAGARVKSVRSHLTVNDLAKPHGVRSAPDSPACDFECAPIGQRPLACPYALEQRIAVSSRSGLVQRLFRGNGGP